MGVGELGEKGEGVEQKTPTPHRHRQQYGNYQRERGWGEGKEGKGGINGDGRRLDLGQ